jgi:hypothetical protein
VLILGAVLVGQDECNEIRQSKYEKNQGGQFLSSLHAAFLEKNT